MSDRRQRILVVLAVLASLAFGYPVLTVVDALAVCCLPGLLPLHLFLVWALVIGLAALLAVRHGREGRR
ncbi:MAG TPA: hypothetical protein ENJ83_00625 [Rhodospirillales bacterium]|nr:hypothetical protein [Rhodospirillales bacterium]